MSRRTSLPGIDELFGPGRAAGGTGAADADAPRPADDGWQSREADEARALLRQTVVEEDTARRTAREAAEGCDAPSPEVGALLRWAAGNCHASTVVEVGSAGGVSGLWLLDGMQDRGVLTSLEPDARRHALAGEAFAAGAARARVRSIQGDVPAVLERLADASYDLILLQTDHARYPEHLTTARRLLRAGGMLVARGVLPFGEQRATLLQFLHELVEDPAFDATVLPIDDGIVLANHLGDATGGNQPEGGHR